MEKLTDRELEQYLYKIAKKTLNWAEVKNFTEEEIWDLVMLDLINIKAK